MHGGLRFLFALALALAAGCGGGSAERPGRPDVILVVLDTLRQDRVGSYGRTPSITPELDAFADQATVYEKAWATSPWTLPSHASLFTGQHTFEHGARTVALDSMGHAGALATNNVVPLSDQALTLAERFLDAGYRTGAIVANTAYVRPRYGLDQGFEHFDVEMRDADAINDAAEEWLDDAEDRPQFLFVNYMDAHRPYNLQPRDGFARPEDPQEALRLLATLYPRVLDGERAPRNLDRLRALYDLAVANLDEGVGDLFDRLRDLGRFEDAVVVVVSDHGEFLGEHELIEHSKDVYEPALEIPFLVKAPGQDEGREATDPVSLVHVPHLIAEHVDPIDADAFAYPWPDEAVMAENHFARIKDLRSPWGDRFERSRRVRIEWPHKYIRSSDGEHELFDLAEDPKERVDLRDRAPAVAASLRTRLRDAVESPRATFEQMNAWAEEPPELSPEEIERLRSLGYF